jgi:pimeloyl-ACP methyl ester carboxylesterase
MPYAQLGDIRLYYEVHGDGPPVLLIPGLGADTRLFFKVVPLLATLHQVVVLDPRGGGRSDKPIGDYSIEQMADDVAGLFVTLGIASADVVGYSLRGKIALQLASRQGLSAWRARTATSVPRPKKQARWNARLAVRLRAFSISELGRRDNSDATR